MFPLFRCPLFRSPPTTIFVLPQKPQFPVPQVLLKPETQKKENLQNNKFWPANAVGSTGLLLKIIQPPIPAILFFREQLVLLATIFCTTTTDCLRTTCNSSASTSAISIQDVRGQCPCLHQLTTPTWPPSGPARTTTSSAKTTQTTRKSHAKKSRKWKK